MNIPLENSIIQARESINRIINDIGVIWKAYEDFFFALKSFIKNSENSDKINNIIPKFIYRAFQETIIIRLRRFVLDRDKRSKSLLASLYRLCDKNKELHDEAREYCIILESNPESLKSYLQKLQEDRSFFCEVQKLEVQKLLDEINNIQKEKTNENRIIEITETFLNNFEKLLKRSETGQIKNHITEFHQKIEAWLIFYKIRIMQDKFIAHSEEPSSLFDKLNISGNQLLNAINYIVKRVGNMVGMGGLTTIIPKEQGPGFLTAFMIPWLQPVCNESQKTESITSIDKYKEENHFSCSLKLTNGLTFQVSDFPPNYEWEEGDEVAIFWGYNPQSPNEAYVICNFSKKQWCKGFLLIKNGEWQTSWILP